MANGKSISIREQLYFTDFGNQPFEPIYKHTGNWQLATAKIYYSKIIIEKHKS